jgi:hypothetical protein
MNLDLPNLRRVTFCPNDGSVCSLVMQIGFRVLRHSVASAVGVRDYFGFFFFLGSI